MTEKNSIIIKGAKKPNLKNIDLSLPRNKLIVITGLSGLNCYVTCHVTKVVNWKDNYEGRM